MAASALGLWLGRPKTFLVLAALILIFEIGLAGYHVGIEQGWFALPTSCAALAPATTIDQLREQLQAAPARCDQVQFTLLGLSLSAWNGIYALASPRRWRCWDCRAPHFQQLSRTGNRAPRSTSRVAPPSTISRNREWP